MKTYFQGKSPIFFLETLAGQAFHKKYHLVFCAGFALLKPCRFNCAYSNAMLRPQNQDDAFWERGALPRIHKKHLPLSELHTAMASISKPKPSGSL